MQLMSFAKTGLGFGLPMLLTGAAFWGGSGWFTEQVLGQTDLVVTQLDTTGTHAVSVSFAVRVLSIDAEIDRSSQVTEVNVRTGASSLQEMEFEYPLADYADIEQAVAQDLGLQPDEVRGLIRYRLD